MKQEHEQDSEQEATKVTQTKRQWGSRALRSPSRRSQHTAPYGNNHQEPALVLTASPYEYRGVVGKGFPPPCA
jgi:hypothetical protein